MKSQILINDTYLVTNSSLVTKLRRIPQFKLDLGMSLLSQGRNIESKEEFKRLNLKDMNMATHLTFFGKIVVKCGYIGVLNIYNHGTLNHNEIEICNNDSKTTYILNDTDIYKFINSSLNQFFKEHGLISENFTKGKEDVVEEKEEYVKPNKPMSEMTEAERILYARNMFK